MPKGVVKTPRDEHKWERAKEIAEEAGEKENWAYIMGIYKRMKPDYFKSASGWLVEFQDAYGEVLGSYTVAARSDVDAAKKVIDRAPGRARGVVITSPTGRRSSYEVGEIESGSDFKSAKAADMAGNMKSIARVASRFLAAYDELGRTHEMGWQHGQVEPWQPSLGEGSQVPPARDNQGQEVKPPNLPKMDIPGYGKYAASFLRSPSSPRDAEPLTSREETDIWDAGYEYANRYGRHAEVLDVDTLFLKAIREDRRFPRGLNESHPQFWEYHCAFAEGVAAYAEGYHLIVEGLPRGIRVASGEKVMLGIDVRSIAARAAAWWDDLEALVREYWSLQSFNVKRGPYRLQFTVDHFGDLHVEVSGTPAKARVRAGAAEKTFDQHASLWDILMWIDDVGRNRGW